MIKYLKWITRDMLRAEPDAFFVFGDNLERRGMGGQAKEMRGEPNAIGIATKVRPGRAEGDYFADDPKEHWLAIALDASKVTAALRDGKTVYVPADGLGTGLSQLPLMAPRMYSWLYRTFNHMEPCPWEKPQC